MCVYLKETDPEGSRVRVTGIGLAPCQKDCQQPKIPSLELFYNILLPAAREGLPTFD